MFCRKCGTLIDESDQFCTYCGTPVVPSDAVPSHPSNPNDQGGWFKNAGSLQDDTSASGKIPSLDNDVRKAEPTASIPNMGGSWFHTPAGLNQSVAPVAYVSDGKKETNDSAPVPPLVFQKPKETSETAYAGYPAHDTTVNSGAGSATLPSTTVRSMATRSVNKPSKKKWIIIGATAALFVCIFSIAVLLIVGTSGPKSPKSIMEDLTEYFPYISIESEEASVRVASVEIEDRKTRDDTDEVYCRVVMESDSLRITSFLMLDYAKYNRNDWRLENVSSYAPEQVEVLSASSTMRNRVLSSIQQKNKIFQYIDSMIDSESATCAENNVQYSFEISDFSGIKSTSGTLRATLSMGGNCQDGYYWYVNVDDSDIISSWNVEGKWVCNKSAYLCNYEFEITIYSLSDDEIDCSWQYAFRDRSGLGLSEFSSGDGADCFISEVDNEKIKIAVHYGTAILSVDYFYFYANGTAEYDFGYNGTGELVRAD